MQNNKTTEIKYVSGKVPSLETILKKIDTAAAKSKAEIVDYAVVAYNRSAGTASKLEGRRFSLSGLLGRKKPDEYYQVDVYQGTRVTFEYQYTAGRQGYDNAEIAIQYTVSALAGREVTLVEQLVRRNEPVQTLEYKLGEWLKELAFSGELNVYGNFERFAGALSAGLAKKAVAAGLLLDAVVSYKGEAVPPKETIRPSAAEIKVQPKGYNDFIQLGFDAVMIPDKQNQADTLVLLGHKRRNEFQELLVGWMEEYIRLYVLYNDIVKELHFKVRSALIDYWNRKLRDEARGWVVAELVLHSADVPPAGFKFEQMEIEVALSNARVPLVNTVILNLEDAELFKNSRVADLQAWIKERLQQTVQNTLSTYPYAKFISSFDELRTTIKSNLDKQAARIGYRVENIITSTLVDQSRLQFQLQLNEEEQVFQTTLNEQVRLNVIITGRIKSLDHETWRNTLTPDTDFVQEIKKDVLRELRQLLLRTHADDFYTRFTEKVEPVLVQALKKLLFNRFNVDEMADILPKMEVSPIRQLIIDLQKGQHTIPISCFSGTAQFRITFSVAAVDAAQWSLFAARNYQTPVEVIAAVGERIRIFVENAVRVMVPDVNVLRDARVAQLVHKYAMAADTLVRDKMGLIIDIVDVEQQSNAIADMVTKANIDAAAGKIALLMEQIRKTDAELLSAEVNGDDEWNVEELTRKRNRLQLLLENEQFDSYALSSQSGKDKFNQLAGSSVDVKKIESTYTEAEQPKDNAADAETVEEAAE